MERTTKFYVGVGALVVAGGLIGYFTRDKWMSKLFPKKAKAGTKSMGATANEEEHKPAPLVMSINKPATPGLKGTTKQGLSSHFSGLELANTEYSGFVKAGSARAKKCWCAGSHGMYACPCGGHHISGI